VPGSFANGFEGSTIISRLVNGCWWLFQWGLVLIIVAALAAGGYLYFRLDDEIRRQVELKLTSHYRHLIVRVGSARFEKGVGITIGRIAFEEPKSGEPLLEIDELFLASTMGVDELLSETLPIDQIVIRRPRAHLMRRAGGQWNIQALSPLPKFSDRAPPIVIEDATISLPAAAPAGSRPLVLRNVGLTLTPETAVGAVADRRYRMTGAAAGLSSSDLKLDGSVGLADGFLDVTLRAVGLELSPELLASVPFKMPNAPEGIQLSGSTDISARITRPNPQAEFQWSAEVKMAGGRLRMAGCPQPFTDVSLHADADGNRLSIKQLRAKWGVADVTLACERNGWSSDAPLGLALRATDLTIDRQLIAALPQPIDAYWRRFEPLGTVNIELRLAFDGQQWRPRIIADCRGISLTDNEKFPYRVEQANGRVEYSPASAGGADRLKIDLTGVGNARPIVIQADLAHVCSDPPDRRPRRTGVAAQLGWPGYSAGYRGLDADDSRAPPRAYPVGWIEISGEAISVHEQLLATLAQRSPKGGEFLRSLRPQGAFDFRWRAEWKDRLQPRAATSLDLVIRDGNILYERFPYPLRNVRGLVTERNRKWEIHDVEARGGNDATVVVCRGEVVSAADGNPFDLTFQAVNVPLDDNLKQPLPAGAKQAWEEFRPQGRVDFTARVSKQPGAEKPRVDVELRPREQSVSIELRRFPFRLEEVEGVARFADGRVDFQEVRGKHGRIGFSARTGNWLAAEGGWQLVLSGVYVDRLEPERDLIGALPPGVQRIIDRLQPSGRFALIESSLSLAKRPGKAALAAAWDVNLDCHQASLAGGIPLTNISGGARLAGQADDEKCFTAGELAIHSLSWKGTQLTSIRGPLWVDESVCLAGRPAAAQQRREPQPLTADAYGGSLTADVRLEQGASSNYRVDLALGGANLARFATERLGGPKELTGTVSGKLSLVGTGALTGTLRGGGELHVVDANIYELPVIVSMLKVLRNRTPNSTAFNRCDMAFQIFGEEIVFNQLNLLGDAVSLYGEGKTNFDRKLDLVFYSLMGPADLPIPLYKTFLGQASRQTLQLSVTGTWELPLIDPKALPGMSDALKRLQTELEAGAATVTSPAAMRNAIAPRR
jgi:hypothetical protein